MRIELTPTRDILFERGSDMKQFWCGAVVPNCTKHFSASTEGEIIEQVAEHAREDHGMAEVPAEIVERVRSLIQDAV